MQDFFAIFANMNVIADLHAQMSARLQERIKEFDNETLIGDIFIEQVWPFIGALFSQLNRNGWNL